MKKSKHRTTTCSVGSTRNVEQYLEEEEEEEMHGEEAKRCKILKPSLFLASIELFVVQVLSIKRIYYTKYNLT